MSLEVSCQQLNSAMSGSLPTWDEDILIGSASGTNGIHNCLHRSDPASDIGNVMRLVHDTKLKEAF
jgi:hypothetical protein